MKIRMIKLFLILVAVFFFSNNFAMAEVTNKNLQIEKDKIISFMDKVDKYIPKNTIVTKDKILYIVTSIETFLADAGYDKEYYIFNFWVCINKHFHTDIKIHMKLYEGYFHIRGHYTYIDTI